MKRKPGRSIAPADLRRRAEGRLRARPTNKKPEPRAQRSPADCQRLVHELEVHQIELELQNTELQEARLRLELLLEKYTDLYDFAPVGYFSLDAQGRIREANLLAATLLGVDRSRLLQRRFQELVLPLGQTSFQSFLREVFARPAKQSGDFELSCPGQPPKFVNIEAQRSAEGKECRMVVMDITAHKQSEELLRQSEERYRTLFNSMDEGYCIIEMIFDKQGKPVDWRYLEVNPSFEKHNGLHDATGKRISAIAPDLETSWFEIYGQVALTGVPVRFEKEARTLGGRWFDLYAFRVGGPDSRRVAVLFSNITARKNTEQELAEKARLLDLSHDAIIVRDAEGRIRYWNHGAEELYGWSHQEALGKIFHRLLRTEYSTPLKQVTRELHRKDRWIGELVHTKRDGQRITVLVRKTLDRDRQGHPASVLENITDITERKRAEETQRRLEVLWASNRKLETEIVRRRAVEKSLKKSERHQSLLLEQSRRMQAQLRHLSHQILQAQEEERKRISRELHDVISQNLVGINVHLETLARAAEVSPRELRKKIVQTQGLVGKSVDAVHEFARELRPTALDDLGLNATLRSFMTDFMKRTGIHVHFTTFVAADRASSLQRTVLYRVVQSALTNVAQHSQASRAQVILRKAGDTMHLEITDDGKSFAVEQVMHARKFKRLGLIGMRERVEMVGGSFTVESAPGHGTTIRAQIPFGNGADGLGGG